MVTSKTTYGLYVHTTRAENPHRWRNGQCARIECGRSWVRESRSGQTKDYQLAFVAYITKHADIRRKSKDWLARNQDNMSEWSDMYIRGLLFVSQHYKAPTKRVGLEQSGPHHLLIANQLVLAMIQLKNCRFGAKHKSLTHSLKLLRTLFIFLDNVRILCVFCNVLYLIKKTIAKLSIRSRNRRRSKRF